MFVYRYTRIRQESPAKAYENTLTHSHKPIQQCTYRERVTTVKCDNCSLLSKRS